MATPPVRDRRPSSVETSTWEFHRRWNFPVNTLTAARAMPGTNGVTDAVAHGRHREGNESFGLDTERVLSE